VAQHPESSVILDYAAASPKNQTKQGLNLTAVNDTITQATTETKLNQTAASPIGIGSHRNSKFGAYNQSSMSKNIHTPQTVFRGANLAKHSFNLNEIGNQYVLAKQAMTSSSFRKNDD
jgi:hypothetical protein